MSTSEVPVPVGEPLRGRLVRVRAATGDIVRVVIDELGDTIVIARPDSVTSWLRDVANGSRRQLAGSVFRRDAILCVLDAEPIRFPDGAATDQLARARARRVVSRERRGTAPDRMFTLVCAAVRHADAIEAPEPLRAADPGWNDRFIETDEDLREAALAYARGLSPADRARLGRSARRRGDGT